MKNKIKLWEMRGKYVNEINKITSFVNDKLDIRHALKNRLVITNKKL